MAVASTLTLNQSPSVGESMDAKDAIKATLRAIQEAEVPESLQPIAFWKTFDLIAQPLGQPATPQSIPQPQGTSAPARTDPRALNGSDKMKRLATALGVDTERLEIVFMEHGEDLQVVVDPASLGTTTAARASSVALLTAAGRQLGGWDENTTSGEVMRAEVNRLGLYDQTNYAKHIKLLAPQLNVNGAGRSATYKLKFPGRQHVKDVVVRLVGA